MEENLSAKTPTLLNAVKAVGIMLYLNNNNGVIFMATYIAIIHQAHKNADYGVFFPDIPGCVFGGKTHGSAIQNTIEGIKFHIEGMLEAGESLIKPRSIATLERKYKKGSFHPFLIELHGNEVTVRDRAI